MDEWIGQAKAALREGPAALVTILATEGSAPRRAGARMVVTESSLAGTIGGGALEHQAMAQARAILALEPGSWRVQDYPLGPMLGQCCGGRVRLLVEHLDKAPDGEGPFEVILSDQVERKPFPGAGRGPDFSAEPLDPGLRRGASGAEGGQPRLYRGPLEARGPLPSAGAHFLEPVESETLPVLLFGAGHVGRSIAERAIGLPLDIAWYDSRAEMGETPGVVVLEEAQLADRADEAPESSAILILTHDHGLDYRLTAAALGSRARFVGLIGSTTKRAQFLSRLAKEGVLASRLTCPIGLAGIEGREPETIAIAVLAQLLMLQAPE